MNGSRFGFLLLAAFTVAGATGTADGQSKSKAPPAVDFLPADVVAVAVLRASVSCGRCST